MKCPKCNTEMEQRYDRIQDHPGYTVEDVELEGGAVVKSERIDGEPINFAMRSNNSWKVHGYRDDPWWCPSCQLIKLIAKTVGEDDE